MGGSSCPTGRRSAVGQGKGVTRRPQDLRDREGGRSKDHRETSPYASRRPREDRAEGSRESGEVLTVEDKVVLYIFIVNLLCESLSYLLSILSLCIRLSSPPPVESRVT